MTFRIISRSFHFHRCLCLHFCCHFYFHCHPFFPTQLKIIKKSSSFGCDANIKAHTKIYWIFQHIVAVINMVDLIRWLNKQCHCIDFAIDKWTSCCYWRKYILSSVRVYHLIIGFVMDLMKLQYKVPCRIGMNEAKVFNYFGIQLM